MGNDGSEDGSPKEHIILHGELDLWIIEAKALPNMDLPSERMRRCFTMFGTCSTPFGNRPTKTASGKQAMITSDPYVSVCLAGATVAQTRIISNCENPSWEEHFCVPVAHPVVKVEFHVKDNDVLGAELIGVVEISVDKIISGKPINDWFPIIGNHGNCLKPFPELHVSIQFKPVEGNPLYKNGVGAGPDYKGVPNTYFPLRKGGSVTLYQDAHVPNNMLPEIVLDGGKIFQQGKCWEDICHAILEAQHLIYIIGWSVYHRVKLVREPTKPLPSGGELALGELLKYKSQEGIRVVMLIWDDKTSHDKLFLKTEGVMQTHDEETKRFFKHSSVHCVLSPRYASNKLSIFKQQVVGTLFTHHQKCVLLDTASGNNRKITAFIGGLDMCDGRYDTPEHRLFKDVGSVFQNDIHNPTFPPNDHGPREPWHDLHCKIEGPAAYDILTNFEQRWRKAKKRDFKIKKVTNRHDDALIRLDRVSWIVSPTSNRDGEQNVRVSSEEDRENWHVQVFRSIDSGSVKGFPKGVQDAEAQNLICGKNLKIDKSIHVAYIKAIRSAQRFIYIENQYFVGSSFYWPSYKNAGADNLIPMELALKVASKIKANERFSVYIVVPMWPEGVPTASATQEILYWQAQTMGMMYQVVTSALQDAGLFDQYHPQDYLNFYCLGNREAPSSSQPHQPTDNRGLLLAQKFRRFMIYVHAKGMIVDDEYVIMGSANINQRSMDGSRDTEIAMGAYQPHHTWAAEKNLHPHGQVYGYRMSLWAEHLGGVEDTYQDPESLECVKRVNDIAKLNWKAFVSEEHREMKGHLMTYPVQIGRDGRVSSLPGYESFPDVKMASMGQPPPPPPLKRREAPAASREDDKMIITPLGAGNEVGRSCVHMTFKGKTVMFDCGIHPAYSGMAALPYFDEIDPSTIDVLLVTHFHLDHAASLPYFLEKTTFKGRVFMTYATKAIYKLLLTDYIKVSKVSVEDMLFDEQDINSSMDKIEVIDFHQTVEVEGIRFWCYTAGHVLGAAMFMVDIAGVRVLYTGDYSREEDRHLRAAETPEFSPDVCIIESTYGVQHHQPRHIREKRFTDVIHTTVAQGGRVLIPVFALGRAQELLLILDEYWSNHPELHNIPIYYASPLAKRCLSVYETYTLSMNDRIRNAKSNPFIFKHISPLKSIENLKDVGPSVVMASPGGLQSGLSRQLFDKWCTDKKNSCVIPGYVVEGTLAKTIINEPKEVTSMTGLSVPLNMQVHYISFSAHADSVQTSAFLEELRPPNIILVHGEANEMGRLKQKLVTQFADRNTKILTPKNCQSVEMYFNSQKMAKAIGRLAEKTPEVGESVSGLLVKKGFSYQIMASDDLHVFSQLSTANVTQRITIPYASGFTVIKHRLKQIYESVESSVDEESGVPTLRVHDRVTLKQDTDKHISLHWASDPISDMVSDSVVALILNINREVPKVVVESEDIKTEEENVKKAEKVIHALLVSLFGDVKPGENGKLVISVDGNVAQLDKQSGDVESENEGLKERVKTAFRRIQSAVKPIPLRAT
ncbi:phospholipase D delta-like [Pyrus ussuriensis x Pyrus communis]|uniref:phospholipase D n=1 Tax=Pyrus ussuriensis x Pyrus communis TaxID=2448454 RepID=A0A5N5HKN0_9ROSA|nr:phospholipase D delta-like [Pyrus ussuriensis x Pyrus communis]